MPFLSTESFTDDTATQAGRCPVIPGLSWTAGHERRAYVMGYLKLIEVVKTFIELVCRAVTLGKMLTLPGSRAIPPLRQLQDEYTSHWKSLEWPKAKQDAKSIWRRVRRGSPESQRWINNIAVPLMRVGHFDDACALFEALLRIQHDGLTVGPIEHRTVALNLALCLYHCPGKMHLAREFTGLARACVQEDVFGSVARLGWAQAWSRREDSMESVGADGVLGRLEAAGGNHEYAQWLFEQETRKEGSRAYGAR